MSTLLPSACATPLVTSGTAVRPPVPVDVDTPAPVRMNQSSSVNVCAPSPPGPVPAAGPNVTRSSTPSNCSAYSDAAWMRDPGCNRNAATMRHMKMLRAKTGFFGRMIAPAAGSRIQSADIELIGWFENRSEHIDRMEARKSIKSPARLGPKSESGSMRLAGYGVGGPVRMIWTVASLPCDCESKMVYVKLSNPGLSGAAPYVDSPLRGSK